SSLKGLDALTQVDGLHFFDNPMLKSVQGLGALKETRALELFYCEFIDDGEGGFESCQGSSFEDLDGLASLKSVGWLLVGHDNTLKNLDALARVTSLESLDIEESDA